MNTTIERKLKRIDTLDLSPLAIKLKDKEEGPGWDRRKIRGIEKEYKNFLKLMIMYPSESIVPSKEIDTLWHYHILDTRKYFEDSKFIFGKYLHHYPYFGLRGRADKKLLENAFATTITLFKSHFGIPKSMKLAAAACTGGGGSSCKGSCYSQH